jgi:iron complex outermembrane receptor protein
MLGHGCVVKSFVALQLASIVVGSNLTSAQQADPATSGNELVEIVVTANKRSENLQNVPITIAAVTADQLAASGVTTTEDISVRIAGLNFQTGGLNFTPYIRGVGTTATQAGADNSVGIYVDGVLITSFTGGFESLNNIQQIEVDKGPQGTLFGRNTTGGVISISTKNPTQDFHTDDVISYGNFDTISSSAYVTGGLTKDLAADLSVYYSDQGDGWGHNLYTGADVYRAESKAIRTKLLYTPTDSDTLTLSADYQYLNTSALNAETIVPGTYTNWGPGTTTAAARPDTAPLVAAGVYSPGFVVGTPVTHVGDTYDIDDAINPFARRWQFGGSLKWQHEFDVAQLVSISADRTYRDDLEWGPSPDTGEQQAAGWGNSTHSFTQELQLLSPSSSRINWVAGAFYLNSNVSYVNPFFIEGTSISGNTAPGAPFSRVNFYGEEGTVSIAGYGQAIVPLDFIDSNTDLTAGIRYTHDKKDVNGTTIFDVITPGSVYLGYFPPSGPTVNVGSIDAAESFNKFTYRLAIDHHFTTDLLGYVSFNTGFKSGGYNLIPPSPQGYQPEILSAWEVGFKNEFWDHRIRANASVFYYTWSDLQVTVFQNTSAVTVNAAKARLYGVDLDLQAKVTDNLTLSSGVEELKDYFTSYPDATYNYPLTAAEGGGTLAVPGQNAAGNQLPYAPRLSLNAGADYVVPLPVGQLNGDVTYYYNSGFRTTGDNLIGQRHYELVNAQIGYTLPDTHTKFSIWGRNLSNQLYAGQVRNGGNPGGYVVQTFEAPRTYGVSAEYKF